MKKIFVCFVSALFAVFFSSCGAIPKFGPMTKSENEKNLAVKILPAQNITHDYDKEKRVYYISFWVAPISKRDGNSFIAHAEVKDQDGGWFESLGGKIDTACKDGNKIITLLERARVEKNEIVLFGHFEGQDFWFCGIKADFDGQKRDLMFANTKLD